MTRSDGWGRVFSTALLAFALAVVPFAARADTGEKSGTEGWGNVYSYSLCAAGVALGAVSGSPNIFISSMIYCRMLYREAV